MYKALAAIRGTSLGKMDVQNHVLAHTQHPCVLHENRKNTMTICPIAVVAGCQKCPAFKICPLKSVLGDAPKADDAPATKNKAAPSSKAGKK
ncbi:MAG: hypothetical protein KBE07_01535 [Rhodoferax sp.]|nr:hypothetical protein [Rhodoferax sp.]MBP9683321.1 hypothetical protein [Rhodoferax sp.]